MASVLNCAVLPVASCVLCETNVSSKGAITYREDSCVNEAWRATSFSAARCVDCFVPWSLNFTFLTEYGVADFFILIILQETRHEQAADPFAGADPHVLFSALHLCNLLTCSRHSHYHVVKSWWLLTVRLRACRTCCCTDRSVTN